MNAATTSRKRSMHIIDSHFNATQNVLTVYLDSGPGKASLGIDFGYGNTVMLASADDFDFSGENGTEVIRWVLNALHAETNSSDNTGLVDASARLATRRHRIST
jgi:hypothetical protein